MAWDGTRRHGEAREDTARHEKTQQGTRRHSKAREDIERHEKTRQGTRTRNVSYSAMKN